MAPSSGHQLLPKVWRVARFAYEKAARTVKTRLAAPVEPATGLRLQPAYARIPKHQPVNKIAGFRQSQSRFFSTSRASTRFGAQAVKGSQIRAAVSRLTTQTPFATALRPNLTGGTLGRTAGGYTIGAGRIGGARYFSSSPAAPAQVVQNVSAGVRAFWLSGQRTRFDGIDKKTGRKQYRVVTTLQDEAGRKMHAVPYTAPGSYIDFELSPTITAFGCLSTMKKSSGASGFEPTTLNTDNLMQLLSIDLARALKDFAAVLNDLKKLSTLGDLPLSLHGKSTLRIRFPGCDAESVERLCDEVGVERGLIHQDEDFELRNGTEMALLFPFAPSHCSGTEEELFSIQEPVRMSPNDKFDWRHMISSEETMGLTESPGQEYHYVGSIDQNPWASPHSGYSSMGISELGDRAFFPDLPDEPAANSASDYGGFQGIYKFIEECDRAKH